MSYVIKAVLSNPRRPECGQITIPFPIPADQYDQTIEMLRAMDLGHSVDLDCTVDDVDSHYSVLGALHGTLVNVDQLDYLAKRLGGFCVGEDAQFQAMACKLELKDIKDFINLTFCCQQTTVITDFSDLEAIGRSHFLNLNGGSAGTEELEHLDGAETALLLIDSGGEVVTPYGVVYDNGMVLKELYNGHQFPAYLYDSSLMVLEITPKQGLAEGKNPECLYLPASARQIERTLLRVGIDTMSDAQVRLYRRCVWVKRGEKFAVWRCASRIDYGTKYCHTSPTLREEPLQAAILSAINFVMSQRAALVGQIEESMRMELIPFPGGTVSILDPASPNFEREYWFKRRTRQMFRVKGISWWPEELPSDAEYEEAVNNLEKAGWEADCVLTHCAPTSIQQKLDGNYTPDRLTDFLQMVKRRCQFRYWFLGHYHRNCMEDDRFIIQWKQMVELKLE